MSRPGETPAAEERWRSFVAIGLDPPVRAALLEYLDRLRATVAGVAWTRAENLHLTLKFLGDVPPTRLATLGERLRTAVAAEPAFTLRVVGAGAFPNLARPQVLWVGIESPRIAALAAVVERACADEGFAAEARRFHPHVTLGRVRDRRRAPDLGFLARDGDRELGVSRVDAVTLFRSELRASGARHSALATLPLAR